MLGIIFLLSFGLGQCQLPWTALPGFYLNSSVPHMDIYEALLYASENDPGQLPFPARTIGYRCSNKPNPTNIVFEIGQREAIYCYTMGASIDNPIIMRVNIALRTRDEGILKAWAPFLKLFHTGVQKLPPQQRTVYRGINLLVYGDHQPGDFTTVDLSFSAQLDVAAIFGLPSQTGGLGSDWNCTIVELTAISARNIGHLSSIPGEEEFIILPGTPVIVGLIDAETPTSCRTAYVIEVNRDQVPPLADVSNLLNDNLTLEETQEYNRFIRDYYKPSFVVTVGKSERLNIATQGGVDDPYNPLPYITNITYGQVDLSVDLAVGQILLGVNGNLTRGMFHEEVENLIESAKMDSEEYTNYTVAAR